VPTPVGHHDRSILQHVQAGRHVLLRLHFDRQDELLAKGAGALDLRPQLRAALEKARKFKCPIVVAKKDARLSTGYESRSLPPLALRRRERNRSAGSRVP
jgi:hypothetical protein